MTACGPEGLAGTTLVLALAAGALPGNDCDGNGVLDAIDIAFGRSEDCNRNAIPDACEVTSGQGFTLTPAAEAASPGASEASLADMTGDGELDALLVSVSSGAVTVLPGGGQGVFAGPIESPLPGAIDGAATGDLDGDGDLDLAAAGSFKLLMFLNDGSGRFEAGEEVIAGSDPFTLVAMDLNGDDLPDLATANSLGEPGFKNVSLFFNRGGAAFSASRNFTTGADAVSLTAADLHGDGDLDLVLAHAGRFQMLTVLENDGAGSFSARGSIDLAFSTTPRLVAAWDLNLDGTDDLFVGQPFRKAELLLSRAGGTFLAQRLEVGMEIQKAVFADMDADGQPDVVAAAEFSPALWFFLARKGILQIRPDGEGAKGLIALGAGDLDGDGDIDLAVFDHGGVRVLANERLPPAADLDQDGVPDECEEHRFVRGDVDQNGRLELSDAVYLLGELFLGIPPGPCASAADADDDGVLGLSDPLRILARLFLAGQPPPPPHEACGPDPTPDALPCPIFRACG